MPTPPQKLTRRRFLQNSAALAATATVAAPLATAAAAAPGATDFASNWKNCPDRVWLGPDYWSNPLQDWRLANGRAECTHAAADRNVHVLTRSLADRSGTFSLRVRTGRTDGTPLDQGAGSVGFRFGIRGSLPDYRNPLVFGRGIDAGLTTSGGLFIGSVGEAKPGAVSLGGREVELRLTGAPAGHECQVTLTVLDAAGRELGSHVKLLPRERCLGGLALVSNFTAASAAATAGKANATKAQPAKQAGGAPGGVGAFWFADWRIAGTMVAANPERAFGPLLFSQYTLHAGVLKLSAQLPPLGAGDSPTVRLQLRSGRDWKTAAESAIHSHARLATFRLERWDATKDTPYRLAYTLRFRDDQTEEHHWTGTIRRDPIDQPEISVADISCNIHEAFPNDAFVAKVAQANPDLLAFTGDQFYESSGGYGIIRTPVDLATIDYLRKWYLHGWTWRELTRDRPSVSLPDDHDVYQGNIWGEGGAAQATTQEAGGYIMDPKWVNVVYLTQAAHHPDAHDPAPIKQGILQYYGPLTYGRISFAIVADRQYKSAPEGKIPPTGGRGDHEKRPDFDPRTADLPGLELLGAKQEQWLEAWVRDWRGAEMKAVISQTIFTSFPTTHGNQREILRADYDTNGWPQQARNRAVRTMRKAFAFHLAGDQHIPGVVHYGVDAHRDSGVGFAGPAVNVGYTRWFEPEKAPWTQPRQPGVLGDFTDSFGHPLTVRAVKNGSFAPKREGLLQFMEEKASGFGLVRFDKPRRKITIDCWPYMSEFTARGAQMPGWPLVIDVLENYGRKPAGHLPVIEVAGVVQPLFEVFEQASGELVYALRVARPEFRPHVFAAGSHTVRISDPDRGAWTELRDLTPTPGEPKPIRVRV